MPPIRFRIRTIMIVIAAVAVVMASAVLTSDLHIIRRAHAFLEILFEVFSLSQIIAVIVFAAVFFVSAVEFLVFWDRYCHQRRRAGQISRKAKRPIRRPEPHRSGEPEKA